MSAHAAVLGHSAARVTERYHLFRRPGVVKPGLFGSEALTGAKVGRC